LNHPFENPWEWASQSNGLEFPYPPLMLYVLSCFYALGERLGLDSFISSIILHKIPLLVADVTVLVYLVKAFPMRIKEILLFYFASPVVIYATYMHAQLDLIPATLFFLAAHHLSHRKPYLSSVYFALALCTKFYVVAALPIFLVYISKNYSFKTSVRYILVPVFLYGILASPYFLSNGYQELVLFNPKQMLIYDSTFKIDSYAIYLPIFSVLMLYARFLYYPKINRDLFYTYVVMLFSVFVFFIVPAPAWYVWLFPFISIFFIHRPHWVGIYTIFNLAYLSFFLFGYLSEYPDLMFMNHIVDLKIESAKFQNLTFTILEAVLMGHLYLFYQYGIKSNDVYQKKQALVIGIGGDSGVGKSTLLHTIKSLLGNKILDMEGDGEHRWERGDENWHNHTHLDPKANLLHTQTANLLSLKQGFSIRRREYDHHTGKFTSPERLEPHEFIVLCGLHPFYLPRLRQIIDLKIYMATDERLRRHWKIIRDQKKRGYSQTEVLQQIEGRVNDAKKYIYPQKEHADMVITYFPDRDFVVGGEQSLFKLCLRIDLDSSVHTEMLLHHLNQMEAPVEWDYADDLKMQYFILHESLDPETLQNLSYNLVPNLDEIVEIAPQWKAGHEGFVQLILLLILSEKMRK
jgi:uridine kinase